MSTGKKKSTFIQSGAKTFEGNMQTSFSVKKSKQEMVKELVEKKEKEERLQQAKKHKEKENKLTTENVQQTISDYQKEQEKKATIQSNENAEKTSFRRLKGFKEMETIEKLQYLLNFPKQLPPVPCIITTEIATTRGFVIALDEQFVSLRLMDQTTTDIEIQTIEEVRMIGI